MHFDVPAEEMKQYLLHVWQAALQLHFNIEETYLLVPKFSRHLSEHLQQMQNEHQQFSFLIEKINSLHSEKTILNYMKQFYEKLKVLIRFEERELFPAIEKILSETEARQLGVKLHDLHKPIDLSWPNEFWKRKIGASQWTSKIFMVSHAGSTK